VRYKARAVASAKRGVRRLERAGAQESLGCRERSAETENALSPCLVEGSESVERFEWPTAENTRRRQRTLYPLFSSETRRGNRLSGRLPKTLGGDRERSTPFSRRRLGEEQLERSTVENARQRQRTLYPLVSSKARLALGSRLRISGSSDQAASRRAERASVKKAPFLYQINVRSGILGVFRLSSLLFIPHMVRSRDKQYSVVRNNYRRSPGIFGIFPGKNILGAPRRNVRTAERSSSCCSARNDALQGASLHNIYKLI